MHLPQRVAQLGADHIPANALLLHTCASDRGGQYRLSLREPSAKVRLRCVCVCVSPPVPKGPMPPFPLPPLNKAGGPGISLLTWSNKARQRDGKHQRTLWCVPATTFAQAVHPTFPRFDSWFFHVSYPLNRFSHSRLSAAVRRSSAAVASLQMRTNLLLKTPSI